MRGRFKRAFALVGMATLCVGFLVLGTAAPAHACSCAPMSVTEAVRLATAVYIGEPDGSVTEDVAGFEVARTLKGPDRDHLEVPVEGGSDELGFSSCATSVHQVPYVLTEWVGGIRELGLCNEFMRGPVAVKEAEAAFGLASPTSEAAMSADVTTSGWPWALLAGLLAVSGLAIWSSRAILTRVYKLK